jgi:hypothetical protein
MHGGQSEFCLLPKKWRRKFVRIWVWRVIFLLSHRHKCLLIVDKFSKETTETETDRQVARR